MKQFLDKDFLLSTDMAKTIYHDYAENMPILDYHCHINPQEIYEDRKFENITQVWLGGDHYKWRQMRSNGVDEKYITGDGTDREKYFGYEGYLNGDTADEVWNLCNAKLQEDSMTVRNLIKQSNVTLICTTDDPVDSLEWHKKLAEDTTFDVQVLPAWRPDKAMNVEKPTFAAYMDQLSKVSGVEVKDFASLKEALKNRMDFFTSMKCCVSDHALEYVMYVPATEDEVNAIIAKGLKGEAISREEELKYKTEFMLFVAKEYTKRNWVMQLHYGCKRDNNAYMFDKLGADTGYDCINNYAPSADGRFLKCIKRNQ